MWLANPVEPRLLSIMEALFEDLGIRKQICWIISRSTNVRDIPGGQVHVWDQGSDRWTKIVQADLKAFKGRFPRGLFGLDLRKGFRESQEYLRIQGRKDKELLGDVMLAAYTYIGGLHGRFRRGEIQGAFLWNQWGYENRALAELCRVFKKPCWYLEQGFLPRTICFSGQGLYDEAHGGRPWYQEEAGDLPDEELDESLERYKGSSVIQGGQSFTSEDIQALKDLDQPLVLVAGQLDKDSNIIFRSPGCKTNWELIRAACATPGVRVLFKPHPYDETDYVDAQHTDYLAERGQTFSLVAPDVKLHELIQLCDVLVTRNSTSGIEAILYDKPVVLTGRAIYHVGCLSTGVPLQGVPNGIRHVLTKKDERRPEEKRAFFRWLIRRHLYFPDGFHPPAFRASALKRIKREFNGIT